MMMDPKERADTLKQHLSGLPASKIDFAKSLLRQLDKKGQLSDKQWLWVDKLADMAQGIPDFTKPEREKIEVGKLTGLITMFEKAAKKLKRPEIVLKLDDGREVRIWRAGEKSVNPGHIYVKVDKHTYAGKVDPTGQYFPVPALDPKVKEQLAVLLRALSRHPVETAAKHGKLHGRCCFCHLPLSDPKSTAVGYGKVCAENYGLPWG